MDEGFVRARPVRVFERVAEPPRYPEWWPGASLARTGRLVLPVLGELEASAERVRPGTGLYVRVAGERIEGHLEWYLEPFKEGTVVYCITNLEVARRWSARRTLRHRASVRSALVALKETLE